MSIVVRELPSEEWEKAKAVPPYDLGGLPVDDGNWRIFVAEDETGKIVAATALHTQVHFDPWWISEDARGNVAVVRGLLREVVGALRAMDIKHTFSTIHDSNILSQDTAEHLGFVRSPGSLYLLEIDHLKEF